MEIYIKIKKSIITDRILELENFNYDDTAPALKPLIRIADSREKLVLQSILKQSEEIK